MATSTSTSFFFQRLYILWGQPFNCGRQSNVVFFSVFHIFFVGHISNDCIGCVGKTQKTRGIFQLKNLPTDGGQLKATDLSTANSSQPESERENSFQGRYSRPRRRRRLSPPHTHNYCDSVAQCNDTHTDKGGGDPLEIKKDGP